MRVVILDLPRGVATAVRLDCDQKVAGADVAKPESAVAHGRILTRLTPRHVQGRDKAVGKRGKLSFVVGDSQYRAWFAGRQRGNQRGLVIIKLNGEPLAGQSFGDRDDTAR